VAVRAFDRYRTPLGKTPRRIASILRQLANRDASSPPVIGALERGVPATARMEVAALSHARDSARRPGRPSGPVV